MHNSREHRIEPKGDVTLCDLIDVTNVSEESATSIFKDKSPVENSVVPMRQHIHCRENLESHSNEDRIV
jgi:hypothetical protein